MDVRILQPERNRVPEMREIVGRHRHGERDGHVHFATALDGAETRRPQVRAAQVVLPRLLHAIELKVELQPAAREELAELRRKFRLVRDAHAVRIEQEVIDLLVVARPFQQLEELRVQRRLATGELENLDAAFAFNDALDALLQFVERHGVHLRAGADGRIRVAGGAREIAGAHDLDERQTGGERFERRIRMTGRVATERADGGAVRSATRRATR